MPLIRDTAILNSINPTDPAAGEIDVDLDLAFNEGASPPDALPTAPPVVPPMGGYADFTSAIKQAVRQAYAQVMAAMAPTPWQDLTLEGSWTPLYGAPPLQYRREGFDIIRLRGAVADGTIGTVIATLPEAAWPPAPCRFVVSHADVSLDGTIEISPSGAISFTTGDNAGVFLDGITFSTTPAG